MYNYNLQLRQIYGGMDINELKADLFKWLSPICSLKLDFRYFGWLLPSEFIYLVTLA